MQTVTLHTISGPICGRDGWSTAIDHHDTDALRALYADRVSFYGRRSSRAEVIRAKQAAFAADPDFHQRIPGYIDIKLGVGDYYIARFYKLSGNSEPLSGTNAKLVVKRGDGSSWLILEEAGRCGFRGRAGAVAGAGAASHQNLPLQPPLHQH